MPARQASAGRARLWTRRLSLIDHALRAAARTVERHTGQAVESRVAQLGGRAADKELIGFAASRLMMWTGTSLVLAAPFAYMANNTQQPWEFVFSAAGFAVAGFPGVSLFVLAFGVAMIRRVRRHGDASMYLLYRNDETLSSRASLLAAVASLIISVALESLVPYD